MQEISSYRLIILCKKLFSMRLIKLYIVNVCVVVPTVSTSPAPVMSLVTSFWTRKVGNAGGIDQVYVGRGALSRNTSISFPVLAQGAGGSSRVMVTV